ncbi:DUF5711 family protein [Roseburia rectibacter]|jgi:hypothetical protein|uniref:DUF5711 family protein n=1 Tax=Roseburia rectibacter TaxID=2763062 RepID=UPI00164CC5E5|nr:DUF5711 family protein [Roseburia rectibacter]UMZ00144.1 DUF5711 family protein [Roseburia rectibacter]
MAEKNKRGFHTVEEPDMEEYERKLREHRIKVVRRTVILIITVLAVSAGLWVFMALRHYENFDVTSSVDRADTEATKFADFGGNILKYSNDGAFYTDTANELIWNQTYEMADPQIDICEDYLTIYDRKGTMIYIMTKEGILGGIETTMPIQQVRVAAQGTVAVLMKKDAAGYLAMYDKTGEKLTEGEIHGAKKGYPIAIALSSDALRLAVAMLDINDGSIKSTIAFYNFGTAGESEIDHVVGAQTFPDTVIPEIVYLADNRLAAFSDTGVILFEGSQKPKQSGTIPFEKEVKSIFYNDNYIGCVTGNDDEAVTHHISVYDLEGKSVLEKDFTMEYTGVEFLADNEICIINENACDIYTIHGIYKFHHEFEQTLYKVISGGGALNYTFILEDTTEKIRLK